MSCWPTIKLKIKSPPPLLFQKHKVNIIIIIIIFLKARCPLSFNTYLLWWGPEATGNSFYLSTEKSVNVFAFPKKTTKKIWRAWVSSAWKKKKKIAMKKVFMWYEIYAVNVLLIEYIWVQSFFFFFRAYRKRWVWLARKTPPKKNKKK